MKRVFMLKTGGRCCALGDFPPGDWRLSTQPYAIVESAMSGSVTLAHRCCLYNRVSALCSHFTGTWLGCFSFLLSVCLMWHSGCVLLISFSLTHSYCATKSPHSPKWNTQLPYVLVTLYTLFQWLNKAHAALILSWNLRGHNIIFHSRRPKWHRLAS